MNKNANINIIKKMENNDLLKITNLVTSFKLRDKKSIFPANNISFTIHKNETVGFVGESGCGKSSLAYSIMQLLPKNGKIISGSIKLYGEELIGMPIKKLQKIRGSKIAIIPQNPMSSFDPIYTIGDQIKEMFDIHPEEKNNLINKKIKEKEEELDKATINFNDYPTKENEEKIKKIKKTISNVKKNVNKYIRERSIELLKLVGINDPEKRLKQYPKELSGGMLQRIMIAMNLICEPDLLIADEPTTALDVTVQAQIIALLKLIQSKMNMGIMIITHDLGIIANICDKVNVMYAGSIIESGNVKEIFQNPKHEYTKKLILSTPKFNTKKLESIEGIPVSLSNLPSGCAFSERCDECMEICLKKKPSMIKVKDDHYTACFKYLHEKFINKEITEKDLDYFLKSK